MPNYEEQAAVRVVVTCLRCRTAVARDYAMYEGDWQDYTPVVRYCRGRIPCRPCQDAVKKAHDLRKGWITWDRPDVGYTVTASSNQVDAYLWHCHKLLPPPSQFDAYVGALKKRRDDAAVGTIFKSDQQIEGRL